MPPTANPFLLIAALIAASFVFLRLRTALRGSRVAAASTGADVKQVLQPLTAKQKNLRLSKPDFALTAIESIEKLALQNPIRSQ